MVAVPIVLWSTAGWPFGDWGLPAGRHLAVSGGSTHDRLATGSDTLRAVIGVDRMAVDGAVRTDRDHDLDLRTATTRLPGSRTMQSIAACLVGTALTVAALSRTPAGAGRRDTQVRDSARCRSIPVISDLDDYWQTAATGAESNGSLAQPSIRIGPTTEGTLPTPGSRETSEARAASDCGTTPFKGREETPPLATQSDEVPGATSRPKLAARRRVVMPRETLWSIAHDELGSATRSSEIANLNYGLRQADGRQLDARHWITPGWQLLLPDNAHPGVADSGALTEGRRSVGCP